MKNPDLGYEGSADPLPLLDRKPTTTQAIIWTENHISTGNKIEITKTSIPRAPLKNPVDPKTSHRSGAPKTADAIANRRAPSPFPLNIKYHHASHNLLGLPVARRLCKSLRRAGVISNFAAFAGTGARGTAQETPEITFSQKALPA